MGVWAISDSFVSSWDPFPQTGLLCLFLIWGFVPVLLLLDMPCSHPWEACFSGEFGGDGGGDLEERWEV